MPLCNGLYFTEFHPQRVKIAQPIIFLHGTGGNALFWPAGLRRLPNMHTFSIDLPGHGKSDPPGRQAVQQYCHFIDAWLDYANIRNPILAGFGLGGRIALQCTANNPQNISGLVLINALFQPRIPQMFLDSLHNPVTAKKSIKTLIKKFLRLQTGNQAHQTLIKSILQTRPTVLAGDLIADSESTFLPQAVSLLQPTCIMESICLKQQFTLSKNFIQHSLPNAQIHLYPHPSNLLPLDATQWVTNVIQAFILQTYLSTANNDLKVSYSP